MEVAEADLEEVVFGKDVWDLLRDGAFADKETLSRLITFERLQSPLDDNLYALRASRTAFQPYQFKPLLKFLRSPKQRLLLADEVGLGKTIEAGFILTEIMARHPRTLRRVLVVCKASLCPKWQAEMRTRFDLRFDIWKADRATAFLDEFIQDPDTEIRAICSLESFRSKGVMERWEEIGPTLDVMIIDEAHHLKNRDTLSHRICRSAAENADAVLALTATPIHIGSRDLFNLLSLLDPEQFTSFEGFEALMQQNQKLVQAERLVARSDPGRFQRVAELLAEIAGERGSAPDLGAFSVGGALRLLLAQSVRANPLYRETVRMLESADPSSARQTVQIQRNLVELNLLSTIFTRTRKRDVQEGAFREPHVVTVELTPPEMAFYNAVTNYVRANYERSGYDAGTLFGLMMPQRQMASCIPAMVDYYRRRLAITKEGGDLAAEESDLDTDDWSTAQKSPDDLAEQQLREIVERWDVKGSSDTKYDMLLGSLEQLDSTQPGEKIVIFSYFKQTLKYLSGRLAVAGYSNVIISGDYPPIEREELIRRFREQPVRILLSSEVGSEGLDFQFCHILFNYDLPWNPMVVEQRIGRLDRYGQTAPVIRIFNFSAPGTIEEAILNRLYLRINIFESYIGDLESILGDAINELTRDLFRPELTTQQRLDLIEQTARRLEQRKLDSEQWDLQSAPFIAQDAFYMEEIQKITALGRYISAADLLVFVREFLTRYDGRSSLVPSDDPKIFTLRVGDRLLRFVQDLPSDPQQFEFLRQTGGGEVRLTFDSDASENNHLLTFLHVRHPFIRGIVAHYGKSRHEFHPVSRITLREDAGCHAGQFLFLVARVNILAAREKSFLLPVFVNSGTASLTDDDVSETLLGRMIREGVSPAYYPALAPDHLERLHSAARESLHEGVDAYRASAERVNDALVEARLASLEQTYVSKIKKKSELLERGRQRQREPRYLRMLEREVANLEQELRARREQVSKQRVVTADFQVIAGGYLEVTQS